jgi:Flp pilus assembly protein TadB
VIAAAVGALAGGLFGTLVVAAWRLSRRRARPPSRSPRMVAAGPKQADGPPSATPSAWTPDPSVGRSASPPSFRTRPRVPSSVLPTEFQPALPRPRVDLPGGSSVPEPARDETASRPARIPARARVVGGAVVAGASVGVTHLAGASSAVLLLACGVGVVLVARASRRRTASRLLAARASAAPAVIDLLGACLLAGLNPYRSLVRVAERGPEILRTELGRATAELEMGRSPAAALRAVGERTGLDELRAAAGALEAAERWGAPPAEALAARAEALRSRTRLRAEAEAGRAAVRLAFPLVFCFLPAFVLLVVVPTTVGALRTLAAP